MVAVLVVLLIVVASVALFFLARPKQLAEPTSSKSKAEDHRPTLKEPVKAVTPAIAEAPKSTGTAAEEREEPRSSSKLEPPPPKRTASGEHVLDLKRAVGDTTGEPEARTSAPPPSKDLAGLRKGLTSARKGFIGRIADLLSGKKEIDPSILADLEEVLLTSDVGPETTQLLIDRLKARLERKELSDADAVWRALRAEASTILALPGGPLKIEKKPTVVLMVGVNGAGKTTTIGKLATRLAGDGKKVLLGAGDTFRAAAVAQLEVWGKRVGADVVKGKEGADPGAVAFQATERAVQEGADVLFLDTAGRLHTKTPLMDEIRKVRRTIAKADPSGPHETLLVLDATTGQNALAQAKLFQEALELTGIVLTKLDGTAKGGIVLGIANQLKVPVRYIGLGERAEDLREFQADAFVEALFANPTENEPA